MQRIDARLSLICIPYPACESCPCKAQISPLWRFLVVYRYLFTLIHIRNLRVCTADLTVDLYHRLLLHCIGDMAVDVERSFSAYMTNHSRERLYVHAVFNCHRTIIERSMWRVGTPTDNPIFESINGWIKKIKTTILIWKCHVVPVVHWELRILF